MTFLSQRRIDLIFYGSLAFLALGATAVEAQDQGASGQGNPVLVELFTSEGCSDCPPADKLLGALDEKQSVPGTRAIVLSEHVTYWNHDGWTDPFSMDEVTERQQEYAHHFGLNSIYTPQIVVDGQTQFVGSDAHALQSAMDKASSLPKDDLAIVNAIWDNGSARFAVRASSNRNTKLIAVLAANETHERVSAGENAGRTLEHVAVVRVIKSFDIEWADGRTVRLAGGPLTHKEEAQGPVRLVVFLADRKTGHVVGAAEQTLTR